MTNWQPLEPNAPQDNVEQPMQPVQNGMQQPAPFQPMMGAQPGPQRPRIFLVLKIFGYIFTVIGVIGGIISLGEMMETDMLTWDPLFHFGIAQVVNVLSLMLVAMCTYYEKDLIK